MRVRGFGRVVIVGGILLGRVPSCSSWFLGGSVECNRL